MKPQNNISFILIRGITFYYFIRDFNAFHPGKGGNRNMKLADVVRWDLPFLEFKLISYGLNVVASPFVSIKASKSMSDVKHVCVYGNQQQNTQSRFTNKK